MIVFVDGDLDLKSIITQSGNNYVHLMCIERNFYYNAKIQKGGKILKDLGKKEKSPAVKQTTLKQSSWNIIIGAIAGLVIGSGISFISGCYSNNWIGYVFAGVIIILATVFGYWVGKNGGLQLLYHEDVYYRIGGYVAFGLVLLLCTWALFFFVIKKNNIMYDSLVIQKIFKPEVVPTFGAWGEKTFGTTWKLFGKEFKVVEVVGLWANVIILTLKYFLNHLIFVIPFIFVMNLFKAGKFNFSTIYFAIYTIFWGIAVGSNSLVFPAGSDPMAGPVIVFARFGLWIWFSYLLLMASTTQFAWLTTTGWLSMDWKKQRKLWPVSFTPDQWEVFIYGLLFLLAASFAEARIFVHYNL